MRHLALLLLFAMPAFAEPDEPVAEAASVEAAPQPLWQATRAAQSPSTRAFRRLAAYVGGTAIIVLLGASFWLYGLWYRRKTIALAQRTPLLSGPGHDVKWPPTPAA